MLTPRVVSAPPASRLDVTLNLARPAAAQPQVLHGRPRADDVQTRRNPQGRITPYLWIGRPESLSGSSAIEKLTSGVPVIHAKIGQAAWCALLLAGEQHAKAEEPTEITTQL